MAQVAGVVIDRLERQGVLGRHRAELHQELADVLDLGGESFVGRIPVPLSLQGLGSLTLPASQEEPLPPERLQQ